MVQRRRFPAPNDYTISVATERMKDGKWSSVATIHQPTPSGERHIDLPVFGDARFPSEADAESFEVSRALEWIEQNAPSAART
jgi:hypothetical protein